MEKLKKLVAIKSVKPLDGYKVHLTFEDGKEKEVDLEMYLKGPVFEPIRNNLAVFRSVKVVGKTIGWDNDTDIDPDVLYYDLKPAWSEETTESELVAA